MTDVKGGFALMSSPPLHSLQEFRPYETVAHPVEFGCYGLVIFEGQVFYGQGAV